MQITFNKKQSLVISKIYFFNKIFHVLGLLARRTKINVC